MAKYQDRIPCVKVEYDPNYWGGDYTKVGWYAYVPHSAVEAHGSVEDAFQTQTGVDPQHIIHYALDEVHDQDGEFLEM